jgi:ABC-2 type transport system ATP-binding protein
MPEPRPVVLRVRNLCKSFGARAVIRDLDMDVAAGETVALAGPNGSGKSTALRLLAGLLPATSGSGEVLGCSLQSLDRLTRNAIGYLPQRAALYPKLSAHENLRLRAALAGLARPAPEAHAALRQIGMTARQQDALATFSGGWVRRIEIAATLIHRPRLLLLDEPTTGVDVEADAGIWNQLATFAYEGGAVIFSSHDRAQCASANRTVTFSGYHDR